MSEQTQVQVQLKIAQIIEKSRHQDEMFLVDSKTAASEIMHLLKQENLLPVVNEEMFKMFQN